MNMDQKVCNVFHDLFGIPADACNDGLSMANLPGWDSVGHMTLVFALEEAFGVEFSPEDISELTSVGRIKALLLQRNRG